MAEQLELRDHESLHISNSLKQLKLLRLVRRGVRAAGEDQMTDRIGGQSCG